MHQFLFNLSDVMKKTSYW